MMEHVPRIESNLCEACRDFDVRSLLLASQAQGPPPEQWINDTRTQNLDLHSALPRFYSHLPNLTSLKRSSERCELCAAIWQQHSRRAQPWELMEEALETGAGLLPIFFGATHWDSLLHGAPSISVSQINPEGDARVLAWFDVFADRGWCLFPGCQNGNTTDIGQEPSHLTSATTISSAGLLRTIRVP